MLSSLLAAFVRAILPSSSPVVVTQCIANLCAPWCSYAYIEFAEVESIELALKFNDTEFKGRPLKVTEKRKNVPGRGRGRGGRGGRGRGFRVRGRRGGRGFRAPRYHPYGGGY